MKNNTENNDNTIQFKKEVHIGLLAIVAGLGFFKVDELKAFVNVLRTLLENDLTKGLGEHNLSLFIFIPVAALAYILYFFMFGFALFQMFKGKNILRTITAAVACYFAMYFFLVLLILQEPSIIKTKEFQNQNSTISIEKAIEKNTETGETTKENILDSIQMQSNSK